MSAFRLTGLRPRDKFPDLSEGMTGEYLLFCLLGGMSVPEGGDEGAEDWLEALLELEFSTSVEVVGGEEPRGDGF